MLRLAAKCMTKYWHLFWKFRKVNLIGLMEYRANFWFWSLVSAVWTLFNFFFFSMIINVSGNIGGWNLYQMYLLLATFTILDSFTWSFFYHNMQRYTEAVFSGELSQWLVKPVNLQFLLMTQTNSYSNISRLLIGLGMLGWSIHHLQLSLTPWIILGYLYGLIVSLAFIYFSWFVVSTCSFWVEKLENINEIVPIMRRLYQVPASVFTGVSSLIFTVLLPFGLLSTVPSQLLLGTVSWKSLIYLSLFTLGVIVVSHLFLKVSIKKYSSVGG